MGTTFIESQVLAQTYNEVQERFTGIDDLAHGWEHVGRVYKLALHIAGCEKADSFIVGMAALLHDLGRATHQDRADSERQQQMHHADLSVTLASELLDSYQVPADKQEVILHAIVAGAIGILRWAVTGAVRRTPDTKSYHPDDPFAEWHNLDDSHYMLDHFYSKLLRLIETMTTETGRALARERTEFMYTYLDEFRRELVLVL